MSNEFIWIIIMLSGAVIMNILLKKSKESKAEMKARRDKHLRRLRNENKDNSAT
jgi:preprotein translocase subunit SecG